MRIARGAVLGFLALAACAPAASVPSRSAPVPADAVASVEAEVDAIFSDTVFSHAFWGVLVHSLESGETVYARNAERMFVPASNMKIVTSAAALRLLGAEHRFRTAVVAAGPVAGGVLRGDLVVVGGGDPVISDRAAGDVRSVFRAWADSLRAHGVTRVTGRVVGVDDVFDDLPLGPGWAWDDAPDDYSAEISGLELNEGVVEVVVAPGAEVGALVRAAVDPPAASVPLRVEAVTAAAGTAATLRVTRGLMEDTVVVTGSVPLDTAGIVEEVTVRNNTAFFASALTAALREAGIAVAREGVDADIASSAATGGDTLFVHLSPPLREILPHFMKPSQNQVGEMLVKSIGRELRGEGTTRAGVAAVDSAMGAWGLPARLLDQADGSGLSRYNLVAPAFLVALLADAADEEAFVAAFPVAGEDGTLASRMRGTPAAGVVRAKTGTLSGVRALSGYFTTAAGERMAFSMIVNHHTLSARDADRIAEAALLRLIALDQRTDEIP